MDSAQKDQDVSSKDAARSMWLLRLAVVAEAINTDVLGTNYALMVLIGSRPESFASTAPFEFGAANYFLPMCGDLGLFAASLIIGRLSDRLGRKICILFSLYMGAIGSLAKYLLRDNFWAFCAATFGTSLTMAILPVGLAYVSDIYCYDRVKTDDEMGKLIALLMLGRTGGGIIAILMKSRGLFASLWVSSALMLSCGFIYHKWLVEPSRDPPSHTVEGEDQFTPEKHDSTKKDEPKILDKNFFLEYRDWCHC